MYIFLKTTYRDEFNFEPISIAPILKKMTPILDPRASGQVNREFRPTLRDESNGIGLVVLSGQ